MTEHVATHPNPSELLWPVLNFIVFVAILVRYLRAPLVEYFRARTVRLREALQAGALARREAAELRATLARDIENLPAVRARLLADMEATAQLERENLLASARKAAERIRSDARLLAEHEVAVARQALRAELIEAAVDEGAALVRRSLHPEDQERFVRDFVAGAGALR